MGALLDGRALSDKIQGEVAIEVANLKKSGISPKLCVILVGENPASVSYVNMKRKACERTGIESLMLKFNENIAQDFLLGEIARLNADKSVSGILVQLPLPPHIDTSAILEAVAPQKDVDGFHPYNVGRLFSNILCNDGNSKNSPSLAEGARGWVESMPILAPATPLGIMELLKAYNISVSGKNVAIIGASNIVGKPLSALMLNAGATISVCHILTKDISVFTKSADIVCVGVGKVNLITADMIKKGAIVVDIGINKIEGKIKGDVDFENVAKKASFITPVPGGVGPMTIAMLLKNTILCAKVNSSCGNSSLDKHFAKSNDSSLRGEAEAIHKSKMDCHDFATQNLAMTKNAESTANPTQKDKNELP